MEKVIFEKAILDYFDDLVYSLFKKEYFGFAESAKQYADNIVGFVISNISTFPRKKTPKPLQYLGSNYIFYNNSSRTTWYIFFEKRDKNYLITGITNNHCIEAKELY